MIKIEDFIKEYERRAQYYYDMISDDIYTEEDEFANGMGSVYRLVAKELRENKCYRMY